MEALRRSVMLLRPGDSRLIEPGRSGGALKMLSRGSDLDITFKADCLNEGDFFLYLFLKSGKELYAGDVTDGALNTSLSGVPLESVSGAAVVARDTRGSHSFCLKSTGPDWPALIERFKLRRAPLMEREPSAAPGDYTRYRPETPRQAPPHIEYRQAPQPDVPRHEQPYDDYRTEDPPNIYPGYRPDAPRYEPPPYVDFQQEAPHKTPPYIDVQPEAPRPETPHMGFQPSHEPEAAPYGVNQPEAAPAPPAGDRPPDVYAAPPPQEKPPAFEQDLSGIAVDDFLAEPAENEARKGFEEEGCDACPHAVRENNINPFPSVFPNSEWVKISYPGPTGWWHYISGKIYKGGVLAAKVLGVPGEYGMAPPIWLEGFGTYLRCFTGDARGYWLMFQDAETGEVLDMGLSPHGG